MALDLDPIYLVNLFLAVIIVAIGFASYRLNKNRIPLYIAIGFLGFAVSHLAFILGFRAEAENYLIVVRILAYIVILLGLYFSWQQTKTYVAELSEKNRRLEEEMASRRQMEETYRSIFENTLTPMIIVNEDMTVYLPNQGFETMSGYTRRELESGMKITKFYLGDEADMAIRYHKARRADPGSAPKSYEFHFVDAGGNIKDVIVNVAMLPGSMMSLLSFLDISERKHAEEALQESENKFRVLAETSLAVVCVYQGDRFVYVNPSTERITGYSRNELLEMNFWDFVHPDYKELIRERGLARQNGADVPSRYEIKLMTKSGEERWADVSAGLVPYYGRPAALVNMFDITERKQIEEDLLDSKLQAELYVDLMSHDINNLNQAAMGYLELAEGAPEEDSKRYISRSLDALNNSARLIDNVRKLQRARSGKGQETVDIGTMLEEVAAMYAVVPGRDVAIHYSPVTGRLVKADSLLRDVFTNIVGNAINHSSGPVRVEIAVAGIAVDGREYWKIAFEDNGPGVPDELKNKIFNRLQRGATKSKGHGLGLHLAKTLVEGYGGSVHVEDRMPGDRGQGSRFVVLLPAYRPVPVSS
ncbi:putative histidine kinase [Methanocella paludicola SANAE]|uniref:histidine kinase n=1 Tax=Methanocella paludicola (strain DSM 17711 / JCM 13418 / NBRC 101707 / SANAE) TaxID=304371 RepID=D1YVF4_METPS|nr:PAS domain S-box protein [Methanocella paludicola]BAI60426.1 putative histidine kinase [Methanocella paludicola SANAE]